MPTVVAVSTFKGGTNEYMREIARYATDKWTQFGAAYAQLFRVATGPTAGQWSFVTRYPSWEAFAKAQDAAATDHDFQQRLAEFLTHVEMTNRIINVGTD